MKPPLKIDMSGRLRELTQMERLVRALDICSEKLANLPPDPNMPTLIIPYDFPQIFTQNQ